jgi:hypothetical protein
VRNGTGLYNQPGYEDICVGPSGGCTHIAAIERSAGEGLHLCYTAVELGTGCSWLITCRIQWMALIKMVMNFRFLESGDLFH